jgi:NADPH:quinone reductase-like Zn-dependent oxidoreductase
VSFSNDPTTKQLERLARYVEEGAIRPIVDRAFPMDGIAEAHRRIEAGGVRGKYVIEIEPPSPGSGR